MKQDTNLFFSWGKKIIIYLWNIIFIETYLLHFFLYHFRLIDHWYFLLLSLSLLLKKNPCIRYTDKGLFLIFLIIFCCFVSMWPSNNNSNNNLNITTMNQNLFGCSMWPSFNIIFVIYPMIWLIVSNKNQYLSLSLFVLLQNDDDDDLKIMIFLIFYLFSITLFIWIKNFKFSKKKSQ